MAHPILSCLTFLGLIVIGWALSRAFFRGNDPRHDLGGATLAGWAWFSLLCVIAHALGLGLRFLQVAWGASLLGALVMIPWLRGRGRLRPQLGAPPSILLLAALIGAGVPALAWLRGTPSVSLLGDDLAHTAHMLEVLRTGVPFPTTDFYPVDQATGADPRFGVAHVFIALLLEPWSDRIVDGWLWLCIPFGAALTMSFTIFARRFVAHRWLLVLALLLQLGFYGGSKFPLSTFAVYPMWIGMGLLHLCLARMLDEEGNPVSLLRDPGLLCGAMALVMLHYFPAIALLTAAGALLLVPPLLPDLLGRLRWLATLIMAVAPGLLFRIVVSYESVNPIHRETWHAVDLGGAWRIFQPLSAAMTMSVLWIPAAIIALGWLRGSPRGPLRWLAVLVLLPPCLVLFPPTATLGMNAMGFLLFRLLLLAPTATVIALAWSRSDHPALNAPWLRGLALVIAGGLAFNKLSHQWDPSPFSYAHRFRDAVEAGTQYLNDDDTIIGDPYLSLAVAGATGHRVVVLPDGRSSPRDARAVERLLAAGRVTALESSTLERWEAARSMGATHIWLQDTFTRAQTGYFFAVRPGGPSRVADQLRRATESFRSVAAGGGWWLFQVLDQAPGDHREVVLVPHDPDEIDVGAMNLVVTQAPAGPLRPGEDLELGVRWILRTPLPELPYLVGYLRVDHDSAVGGFKPLRKLKELVNGNTYRKRLRFEPGADLRPAYLLEVGEAVEETLTVRLPDNLAPGTYQVRLLVEIGQRSREIRLSDYFKDLDSYTGVPVASVEVEAL